MFSGFKKEKRLEYISGRIATKNDIKYGFFSLITDSGEKISVPYKIEIPQEVLHINKKTQKKSKGILIQAELVTKTHMKGHIVCTVRLDDDQELHCLIEELQLSKNKFDMK